MQINAQKSVAPSDNRSATKPIWGIWGQVDFYFIYGHQKALTVQLRFRYVETECHWRALRRVAESTHRANERAQARRVSAANEGTPACLANAGTSPGAPCYAPSR